jgi:tetratricopeptide (TPR) repeat protein
MDLVKIAENWATEKAETLHHGQGLDAAELEHNAALVSAIDRYKALLLSRLRARAPLQWATTKNSLGAALERLGERESETARLEEAASAYREALEEYTHARAPLQWALGRAAPAANSPKKRGPDHCAPVIFLAILVSDGKFVPHTRTHLP